MGLLDFHIRDVFTDRPFAGNSLAFVKGADGLSAAQRRVIARRFNRSETIFDRAPRDPAHDARVRIFFPAAEIPFAGHPTVGCATHLRGGRDGRVLLEGEAGLVSVEIRNGLAEFVAPRLPVAHPGRIDPAKLAPALDLPQEALGFAGRRPGIRQGRPRSPLCARPGAGDALASARPVEPFWSAVMAAANVDCACLYAAGGEGYRARMFSPSTNIPDYQVAKALRLPCSTADIVIVGGCEPGL